jgi:hypothetical protein
VKGEAKFLYRAVDATGQTIDFLLTAKRDAAAAWRTIEGYEAMHAIRKGQVRWVAQGDAVAHRQFIHTIFAVAS